MGLNNFLSGENGGLEASESDQDLTVIVKCSFFSSVGVDPALGAEAARRCQEKEEEVLHHPQEEQAQEEEGQARCAQILQGKNPRVLLVLIIVHCLV